jgi:Subtilase family
MRSTSGVEGGGAHRRRGRQYATTAAAAGYGMLVAATILLACGAGDAQPISEAALQQIRALSEEKAARTVVQRKIGSHLLYAAKQQRGEPIARGMASLRLNLQTDAGSRVLVDISAAVSVVVVNTIVQLGGAVVSEFPEYGAIRAWLPVDAIEPLAALADVRSIRPAAEPTHRKLTTSEGDAAHRANLARSAFAIDGSGVKVGALSDSVDFLSTVQATGDVAAVTVLPGLSGVDTCPPTGTARCTGEGTALLEIVSDLAPGASLFFATADGGDAAMAASITALRAAGCDIIFDDISYFDEPVFQDGVIAQAVDAVTADGAVYVSAAGNGGNEDDATSGTWEGNFVASSTTFPIGGGTETLHDFGGGITLDRITTQLNPGGFVVLQWSDAFGASANDYDLFLLNASGTQVVAASTDVQNGTGDPLEGVDISQFRNTTGLQIAIGLFDGSPRCLHLDTNEGGLTLHTAGEIYGHSAAVSALSIAAVSAAGRTTPFTGGAADPVEPFSSDGLRRIFYEADGTPITPGNLLSTGGTVRQKPDVAAADGVSVSTPGFDPFFGTSAAAAHAAAIAALAKSANPGLSASQIQSVLTSTALDVEAAGVERDSGYGLLDALAAVQSAAASPSPTPTITCVGDCDGGGDVAVKEIITVVRIALGSTPLSVCTVGDANGDGEITVDEIIAAIYNDLASCPA